MGESICEGDSGGPAFDSTTGAVVGIVSRGGNGTAPVDNEPAAACVDASNFYSEPSHFEAVIDAAYTAAGATPDLETGRDAGASTTTSSSGGSSGGCTLSAPGDGGTREPSRAGLGPLRPGLRGVDQPADGTGGGSTTAPALTSSAIAASS